MSTLFHFELRKILNKRALWLVMALGAALMIFSFRGNLSAAFSGRIQGMRDVYRLYEGEILTDALCRKMTEDYKAYAAAHPEWFKAYDEELGYWPTFESVPGMGRAIGLALTFRQLSMMRTKEYYENQWQQANDALQTGMDAEGNTLTPARRTMYEFLTGRPPEIPIVQYNIGWTDTMTPEGELSRLEEMMGVNVIFWPPLLALLVLWMVPVFVMERGARMEALLLSAPRRRKAAWAKGLAGIAIAAAATAAFCLLEIALQAATLGLDGATLPSRSLSGLSNMQTWTLSALAITLSGMACAAVMLAASAMSRGNLAALGVGCALLATQYALYVWVETRYIAWWMDHATMQAAGPWWKFLMDGVSSLPLRQLIAHQTVDPVVHTNAVLVYTLLVPLALCAACLWLAPRFYLRKRRV